MEEPTEEPGEPPPPQIQMLMGPEHLAGVYANFAQVSQSDYEFAVDFARLDFAQGLGVVVARLNISPVLAAQLTEVLTGELEKYAQRALQEVIPNESDEPGDSAGDDGTES